MFDPYGKVTVLDGNGTPRTVNESLYGNPWTFTGRRLDGETGLMQYRARMYDVGLGRFVSRDPAGYVDGYNLLAAVFVPKGVDPSGEVCCVVDWKIKWDSGESEIRGADIYEGQGKIGPGTQVLTPEEAYAHGSPLEHAVAANEAGGGFIFFFAGADITAILSADSDALDCEVRRFKLGGYDYAYWGMHEGKAAEVYHRHEAHGDPEGEEPKPLTKLRPRKVIVWDAPGITLPGLPALVEFSGDYRLEITDRRNPERGYWMSYEVYFVFADKTRSANYKKIGVTLEKARGRK
jgi:RHS repeat-associated protein